MKSIFLCLFFLIVFFQSSFSQSRKFEVGIVGGPSLSLLFGSNVLLSNFNKPIVRYAFGGSVNYNFTNNLSLLSNIMYQRKGGSSDFIWTDATGSPITNGVANWYFDYLTVPLLFKPSFGNRTKVFFTVGPSFDFLIKATHEFYLGNQLSNRSDETNAFNSFNMSLVTGIGIDVPISERFNFNVELRNNLGLLYMIKLLYFGPGSFQTNSTNLLLGVSYKM